MIGLTAGFAGAYAATRAIQSLLFQVRPNDPATFVAATVMLAAIGLVATAIPAHRATRVSPAVTLKDE